MTQYDILIVGGGAAGMAAALKAKDAASVLLVERDCTLGGVLNQCLHEGFGLGYFGESITGVEYAHRFRQRVESSHIRVMTGTTVLSLEANRTALLSGDEGVERIRFRRCILATGCRECAIGSLPVCGTRPAGIFTAGTAQRMTNIGHYDVGDRIVILGSGDIGQIMARRLSLLGKQVVAMIEQNDHLGGMARNQRECIEAFRVPVILNATVDEIFGTERISGVSVRNLDSGDCEYLPCDTLITALGLIPERELVLPLEQNGTFPPWLSLCGNCDHVHEIVDAVTKQAEAIGKQTAENLGC